MERNRKWSGEYHLNFLFAYDTILAKFLGYDSRVNPTLQ